MKNNLLIYWEIGKHLSRHVNNYDNIFIKYSEYFSYYFGTSYYFDRMNIFYMYLFYLAFPIYYNKLNDLSWEHYKLLLKVNNKYIRYFYFRVSIFCNLNINDLDNLISHNYYDLLY